MHWFVRVKYLELRHQSRPIKVGPASGLVRSVDMARSLQHLLGEGITNDWPLCDRVTSLLASSYFTAAETRMRLGRPFDRLGEMQLGPVDGLPENQVSRVSKPVITRGPNLRRAFLGAVI